MFTLDGKKVLVTGGTSGIGYAVARRFVSAGAHVVITGRRESGSELAAAISAEFVPADITVESELETMLESALERLGAIDVLVNNAGLDNNGVFIADQTSDELQRCFSLNFNAVYSLIALASKRMSKGSSIIVTSSVVGGFIDMPAYSQYSASKAALISLVRTAALELAPRDIRVNAVCPGSIFTEMLPPEHPEVAIVEKLCPMERVGEVEDVIGLYHFLAADESRYITGQKIAVDGGISAGISLGALAAVS